MPGSRSPSTRPRTPPSPVDRPRPPRQRRGPAWPRSASVSVLRLGLLIGGLVIIADLGTQVIVQHTLTADDANFWRGSDEIVNFTLFALLGILIVRDTGLWYAGLFAGVFASLLDAIVVAAASLLAPAATPLEVVEELFFTNLAIGTVFAGVSGFVYSFVQRWSSGRRSR
jgi:hypothetical protein